MRLHALLVSTILCTLGVASAAHADGTTTRSPPGRAAAFAPKDYVEALGLNTQAGTRAHRLMTTLMTTGLWRAAVMHHEGRSFDPILVEAARKNGAPLSAEKMVNVLARVAPAIEPHIVNVARTTLHDWKQGPVQGDLFK